MDKICDKNTCSTCDNLRTGKCEYGGLEYWCKFTYEYIYPGKIACNRYNKTKDKK